MSCLRYGIRCSVRFAAVAAGALALLSIAVATGLAQQTEAEEPLLDELREYFQRESFSVGVLFQFVADFQPDRSFSGSNGFSLGNARVRVYGELDGGFGYLVQANLIDSPAVLDAAAHYRVASGLVLRGGLFKAPFSREFLTGAGSIDFVNRSQVVRALVPGRELGAQVGGTLLDGELTYGVGLFNGNRFGGNGNDSDEFLWVGRVSLAPAALAGPEEGDRLEIGINVGSSDDESAPIGDLVEAFDGERTVFGADARFTRGRLLLSGEVISARLEPEFGAPADPVGFYLTIGYHTSDSSQLLFRWDSFSPDGIRRDLDLLILGLNVWPTGATELQFNYIVPTQDSVDNHQLLVNAQVGF